MQRHSKVEKVDLFDCFSPPPLFFSFDHSHLVMGYATGTLRENYFLVFLLANRRLKDFYHLCNNKNLIMVLALSMNISSPLYFTTFLCQSNCIDKEDAISHLSSKGYLNTPLIGRYRPD